MQHHSSNTFFGGMGVIARAVAQSVDKVARQMKTALVGDELIGLTLELSGRCRNEQQFTATHPQRSA